MQNTLQFKNKNVTNLFGLQTVVMPGRGPTAENKHFYNEAYKTWQLVWKQTLLELDGSDELYSDHFTRQDYMVALFHGSVCVALTCFRRAELSNEAHRNDSWFKPWPVSMVQDIGAKFGEGIVVSWVTIHPDYRKTASSEHIRDLNVSLRLGEVLNLFLDDCNAEIAYGVTRNNRSVNKFCERAGSVALSKNATHHGVDVDLIAWYPEGIKRAQKEFEPIAFKLWSERQVYFDRPLVVTQGALNNVELQTVTFSENTRAIS